MRGPFYGRSTSEILVLAIAFTICFSVLASGAVITIIAVWHPDADLSIWLGRLGATINTLIGLLAGYLAGRGEYRVKKSLDETDNEADGPAG